jgi:hypothetical protein
MPVATMLAIAASFWAQHGYTVAQPVGWNWDVSVCAAPISRDYVVQACGAQYVVHLNRKWWDQAPSWNKCEVVIHEVGHAAFRFPHTDYTVMSAIDDVGGGIRTVPGTCKRRWTPRATRPGTPVVTQQPTTGGTP